MTRTKSREDGWIAAASNKLCVPLVESVAAHGESESLGTAID